mgnify:CR=1 FL=1
MPCGHAAVAGFGNTGEPARSAHNVYTWPAGCVLRPLALPWPQHANAVATYRSSSVPNTRVKCSAMATAAVNCDQAATQQQHKQTLSTSFGGDTPLETTPATQVRCGQALRLLACGGVARGSISGDDQLRHEKLGGLTLDHQIAPSDRGYCTASTHAHQLEHSARCALDHLVCGIAQRSSVVCISYIYQAHVHSARVVPSAHAHGVFERLKLSCQVCSSWDVCALCASHRNLPCCTMAV